MKSVFARSIRAIAVALIFCSSAMANTFSDVAIYGHTATPPLYMLHSVPGPMVKSLSTFPNYWEFEKSGSAVKGSVGALGSFEMNLSTNMNYADNTHRLYDKSQDAYWLALGTHGLFLQYAPATDFAGNVWDHGGNQYGFKITTKAAEFNGDVTPIASGAASVGSAAKRYRELYLNRKVAAASGAVTINAPSGRAFVPAGETSVVVSNSLAGPGSMVLSNVSAGSQHIGSNAVPSQGQITLHIDAVQAFDVPVDFFLMN